LIVKLQIFPTLVCLLFLVTIIIFGELTSVTSEERITMNIIFTGATPINQQKVHMPVSFVFAYARSVSHRGEHEKYLFLSLYGNTENPLVAARTPGLISHSEKAKGRLCFVFSVA